MSLLNFFATIVTAMCGSAAVACVASLFTNDMKGEHLKRIREDITMVALCLALCAAAASSLTH